MVLNELWSYFESEIFPIESTDILFNQYNDNDPRVDLSTASEIRKENLKGYFESFTDEPRILLIGEAPGPWGCRFSGVPFTSERQLTEEVLPFYGKQSSKHNLDKVKNKKVPFTSNTSAIFWEVMKRYHPKFFVWNCVPFHPHKSNDILGLRTPTRNEQKKYFEILKGTVDIVNPDKILAVGKRALGSLKSIGCPCIYIRHPSFGGAREFRNKMIECLD